MYNNVIKAQNDFDDETEAGIILKLYTQEQLEKIAARHAKRNGVEYTTTSTSITFYSKEEE